MGPDCEAARVTVPPPDGGACPEHDAVADLLAAARLYGDFEVLPLPGGANNRVYRVNVNGTSSLLKHYFRHPNDPRDRLLAEFSFSTFAWDRGLRALPRPLACSFRHRLGLYEFVDGRPPEQGEITGDMVGQLLDFYLELNCHRQSTGARALPVASEACASIEQHLSCVEQRIGHLGRMDNSSAPDREAVAFVRNELYEVWIRVRGAVVERVSDVGLTGYSWMSREDWRLSPSDLGFHNVVMPADGRLRLVDFEYAGWDDPARMVCDFFCQQEVPVPVEYHDLVRDSVGASVSEPSRYHQRVEILLPVYRMKWCCILLNDFLPEGRARRQFAGRADHLEKRKAEQLQKARRMLATVER